MLGDTPRPPATGLRPSALPATRRALPSKTSMVLGGFVLVAVMFLVAGAVAATAAEPQTEAANAAVAYIRTLQNADGGFLAFGEESSPGSTIDAVFALKAAGVDPTAVTNNGNSPFDYLAMQAETYAADPGGAAKLALGVSVARGDASDFGGVDLLSIMEAAFDPATGAYGLDTFDQSLYLLALAAAGDADVKPAVEYLRQAQDQGDGGWPFAPGDVSDTNTTAIAIQALLASGKQTNDPAVGWGLLYLASAQNDDGGFGFTATDDSDPNSTALVIQALVAAGENIDAGGPWTRSGRTPLDGLLAFRNAATGAFQYGGEDNAFATYQAVPALLLAPFPDLETRIVRGPTPIAPTVVEAPATPTPTAVAPALPPSGSGGPGSDDGWWAVVALLAAGAGAVGVAVAARRSR